MLRSWYVRCGGRCENSPRRNAPPRRYAAFVVVPPTPNTRTTRCCVHGSSRESHTSGLNYLARADFRNRDALHSCTRCVVTDRVPVSGDWQKEVFLAPALSSAVPPSQLHTFLQPLALANRVQPALARASPVPSESQVSQMI